MSKNIEEARRSLEKAKQAAEAKIAKLDEDRRGLKLSIKSLDAALRALTKRGKKQNPSVGAISRRNQAEARPKLTTKSESPKPTSNDG